MPYSDVTEEYFEGILVGQDDNQKKTFKNRLNDAGSVKAIRMALIKYAPRMGIPRSALLYPHGRPIEPFTVSIKVKLLRKKTEEEENYVCPASMQWEPYSKSQFSKLVFNLTRIVKSTPISTEIREDIKEYQLLIAERELLLGACDEYHLRLSGEKIRLKHSVKNGDLADDLEFEPMLYNSSQIPISFQPSHQANQRPALYNANLSSNINESSSYELDQIFLSTLSTRRGSFALDRTLPMQRPTLNTTASFTLDRTINSSSFEQEEKAEQSQLQYQGTARPAQKSNADAQTKMSELRSELEKSYQLLKDANNIIKGIEIKVIFERAEKEKALKKAQELSEKLNNVLKDFNSRKVVLENEYAQKYQTLQLRFQEFEKEVERARKQGKKQDSALISELQLKYSYLESENKQLLEYKKTAQQLQLTISNQENLLVLHEAQLEKYKAEIKQYAEQTLQLKQEMRQSALLLESQFNTVNQELIQTRHQAQIDKRLLEVKLQNQIKEFNKEKSELLDNISSIEKQLEIQVQDTKQAIAKKENLEQTVNLSQQLLNERASELLKLKHEIEALKLQLKAAENKIKVTLEQLNLQSLQQHELDKKELAIREKLEEQSLLARETIDSNAKEISTLKNSLLQSNQMVENLQKEKIQNQKEITALQDELSGLTLKVKDIQREATNESDTQQKKVEQLQEQLKAKESEMTTIKQLLEKNAAELGESRTANAKGKMRSKEERILLEKKNAELNVLLQQVTLERDDFRNGYKSEIKKLKNKLRDQQEQFLLRYQQEQFLTKIKSPVRTQSILIESGQNNEMSSEKENIQRGLLSPPSVHNEKRTPSLSIDPVPFSPYVLPNQAHFHSNGTIHQDGSDTNAVLRTPDRTLQQTNHLNPQFSNGGNGLPSPVKEELKVQMMRLKSEMQTLNEMYENRINDVEGAFETYKQTINEKVKQTLGILKSTIKEQRLTIEEQREKISILESQAEYSQQNGNSLNNINRNHMDREAITTQYSMIRSRSLGSLPSKRTELVNSNRNGVKH